MLKLCIAGAKGKMGERILVLAKDDAGLNISGEFDIGDDPKPLIEASDCLIEFTTPEATLEHVELCKKLKKAIVIGTTGLSAEDQEKIKEASKAIPIVFSPNMSIGVNLLFKMVADASKILGTDYGVEVVEAHHVHKKDAPSGTAKEIARIVKSVRGDEDVPIESIREDEIVGEHTVIFDSAYDMIEITHSAKTRDIFVKGALQAAKWLEGKPAGLYTMKDVLEL
jgi:4-hydroxy-tetrahydrodipicolinate reductase